MAKWSEKHMYNWMGWMRSLYALYDKILCWTVTPTSPPKFLVFVLNATLGSLLLGLITVLMSIPQTLEWIMKNIGDEVNKLGRTKGGGIKYHIKDFTYVMSALFVLIPYALTWGLPKLIGEIKQRRVEKRLQKQVEELRQADENRRTREHRFGMERAIEELGRQRREIRDAIDRKRKEDFRPKKIVKLHQFGDTPKIRIFTRDEFVVERNRVGNTSTARVTRHNRRGNE